MSRFTCVCVPPLSAIVGALKAQLPPHTNEPLSAMRSPAFSELWAAARIEVCVHGAPVVVEAPGVEEPLVEPPEEPADDGGAVGAGTWEQFGVPLMLAAVSAGPVCDPTMPSTGSFAALWNQRTAAVVRGPSLPSTLPALQPSALSCRWMFWTVAASLVPGFVFGSVLPVRHERA